MNEWTIAQRLTKTLLLKGHGTLDEQFCYVYI
jgi:hypothetical protein